jgi:hypothetical protein
VSNAIIGKKYKLKRNNGVVYQLLRVDEDNYYFRPLKESVWSKKTIKFEKHFEAVSVCHKCGEECKENE